MPIRYYQSTATKAFMTAVPGEPDGIPILDPTDPDCRDVLFPKGVGFGHDPSQYVPDLMAAPDGMRTYPRTSWDDLYEEEERAQSSLEHLYLRDGFENLDQDGDGYCWSYSTGHAAMIVRLRNHLPYRRLNPHSVASIIKQGRDEGGWCGLSLPKYREIGCAEEGNGPGQWPLHSRNNRRFDDPAVKTAMLKNVVTDDWYDLGKPVYSQQLKEDQLATCLFNKNPSPVDYNEWGHSICALRWVRTEAGNWCPLILNSWKKWGRRGLAVIQSSWKHDGAVSVVNVKGA